MEENSEKFRKIKKLMQIIEKFPEIEKLNLNQTFPHPQPHIKDPEKFLQPKSSLSKSQDIKIDK